MQNVSDFSYYYTYIQPRNNIGYRRRPSQGRAQKTHFDYIVRGHFETVTSKSEPGTTYSRFRFRNRWNRCSFKMYVLNLQLYLAKILNNIGVRIVLLEIKHSGCSRYVWTVIGSILQIFCYNLGHTNAHPKARCATCT